LDGGLIDMELYYRCLKFGDIKGEAESKTMVAQDQAISAYYIKRILKQEFESKC
jgi:hypothetical protein